jgi:hypothetical protein
MRGRRAPTARRMKKMPEEVTSVSSQLHVKATITAAMMSEVNSTNTPSFSEMPSCRTLLVDVIVLTA